MTSWFPPRRTLASLLWTTAAAHGRNTPSSRAHSQMAHFACPVQVTAAHAQRRRTMAAKINDGNVTKRGLVEDASIEVRCQPQLELASESLWKCAATAPPSCASAAAEEQAAAWPHSDRFFPVRRPWLMCAPRLPPRPLGSPRPQPPSAVRRVAAILQILNKAGDS